MRLIDRKIVLEDGSEYYGYGFGSYADRVCEIVFNTSMVGYQEIVSDPSYTDQAVVPLPSRSSISLHSVAAMTAFIVCIRFSASLNTTDCGPSKTSSVTSISVMPNFSPISLPIAVLRS